MAGTRSTWSLSLQAEGLTTVIQHCVSLRSYSECKTELYYLQSQKVVLENCLNNSKNYLFVSFAFCLWAQESYVVIECEKT